jgi:hypothetical protein
MYVELSARQTGKTTRMVDHMCETIMMNHINFVYLVVMNVEIGAHIKRMVKTRLIDINGHDRVNQYLRKIMVTYEMTRQHGFSDPDFYYVDEFCYLRSQDLLIRENTYYCSTPNGNQDFSLDLVNYCNYNDIQIHVHDYECGTRPSVYNYDDYRVFNEFVECYLGMKDFTPKDKLEKHFL